MNFNSFIRIRKLFISILIILILIIILFPVYWMLSYSFKTDREIASLSLSWIPKNITLTQYRDVFTKFKLHKYLFNSIIIAVTTTVISLILGVMAAYGFSRYNFPGSSILLFIFLLTRVFTPAALVLPLYRVVEFLGLNDSPFSIVIGVTVANLPFVVYIMKSFFDNFPKDIEEAAMIDGMSSLRVLISIVIPLVMPAIVTVALFSFTAGWNDFLFSISFSQTIKSMPGTVAIANMDTEYKIYWGAMMSGGIVLSIPILIITFILQRYFVKGITIGAVKD